MRVAPLWTSSDRGVRAKLDLIVKQAFDSAVVQDEDNEIGGLPANLKANAASFQGPSSRGAPWTRADKNQNERPTNLMLRSGLARNCDGESLS